MTTNILEAQQLYFSYPDGTQALAGLSVTIEKGSKVAILGPNGTGKSTFLLHLIGILKPTKGDIFFEQKKLDYRRASLQALRSRVGFVFQDPDNQLFSASVWQEVSFGPMNLGWSKEKVIEQVNLALDLTGTAHLKERPIHALSYGQKKLIAIAGVLAMAPEVIILDEPTASLDPQYTNHILKLLEEINSGGTTVIMATHDVDLAYTWADTLVVMKDGRVLKKGQPVEVFLDDEVLQASSLTKPYVLEIFQQLQRNGYFAEDIMIPRSRQQLLEIIAARGQDLINKRAVAY
ncbi:energy-coupling factor ABC transporter ATP-binding protein [Desulforamulus ferrireducens]|uniref:ABC transporter ATP-binding protein n=1 Tax=Desulforamulus ferrireducens TaxID=1833852 RepID=A0A1S6IWP3_9FIRM|nr:ATP-binding cassette domain-containing protein [Desulforamulus ferrireducens]AQS59195.1 energy-coupling factor ABC transporter ATP-binding protein [Desulforamulus ferrireducens]